jgi:hypothetical protein
MLNIAKKLLCVTDKKYNIEEFILIFLGYNKYPIIANIGVILLPNEPNNVINIIII